MNRKLLIAVVLAMLAWSGWWFWSAHSLRQEFERWFAERRADGWDASYDDLAIRGYPNRLDATFTGLLLADPKANTVWRAPFFQILQLTYKPGHVIAVWPPEQTLSVKGTDYAVTADHLRASLIFDPATGHILRANAEATVLNIAPSEGPATALAGLTAAVAEVPAQPRTYRVTLRADAAARSETTLSAVTGDSLDGVLLDATLHLDRDWTTRAGDPRPQPTRVELRLAEYRVGTLDLKLAGDVDVDDRGRMTGRMTVKAENWRDLIDLAEDSGRLSRGVAQTLTRGLGLVAQFSGNPETLDLPLDLDEGRMSLGPIPLGKAPRLRLP